MRNAPFRVVAAAPLVVLPLGRSYGGLRDLHDRAEAAMPLRRGPVAIVTNRSRTLAEWAYAGYVFDLVGAVASHLTVGDGPIAAAPAVMLALVLSSHHLYSHRAVPLPP